MSCRTNQLSRCVSATDKAFPARLGWHRRQKGGCPVYFLENTQGPDNTLKLLRFSGAAFRLARPIVKADVRRFASDRSFVGSIDQGTSSSRFILFDASGKAVASHQEKFPQHHPNQGWVEHDPNDLLNSVKSCIRQVMGSSMLTPDMVKAVGITNQRETSIAWDKTTGEPLYNAIVWNDVRTQDIVLRLIKQTGDRDVLRPTCGLPIHRYFSALKFRWLLENCPRVAEAAKRGTLALGTVDSWLIWKLTGGPDGGQHVTDVSNASRTMMMSLSSCKWDTTACELFGIEPAWLPGIRSSSEKYGSISAADVLLSGVPITGCLGDQQAALLGQGCITPGSSKNTYGTGCFMLQHTGSEPRASKNGMLTTVAAQLGPSAPVQYALEGSVAVAGDGLKWLIQNLRLVKDPLELDALAASVPDANGTYFVPAFSGLLSPHWVDDARGVWTGLSYDTMNTHLARAVIEAAAFQTRDVLAAMGEDSGVPAKFLKVDGGMCKSKWLLQFQADLLQVPVVCPANVEATALGAAFAAGLAVDFWPSVEACAALSQEAGPSNVFQPSMDANRRASLLRGWTAAIEASKQTHCVSPPKFHDESDN